MSCASTTGWIPPDCTECNTEFIYDAEKGTCNQCKPNKWGTFCNNTCPGITHDNKPCHGNGVCLDGVKGVGKCVCSGFLLSPKTHCISDWLPTLAVIVGVIVLFTGYPCYKAIRFVRSKKLTIVNSLKYTQLVGCLMTIIYLSLLYFSLTALSTGTDPGAMYVQSNRSTYIKYTVASLFLYIMLFLNKILLRCLGLSKKNQERTNTIRDVINQVEGDYSILDRNLIETKQEHQQDNRNMQQGWLVGYSDIQLQKVIGQGAFGQVWQGRWRGIDIAVKKIFPEPEFASNMMLSIESNSTSSFGSNGTMNDISKKMLDDLEVGVMMRLRHPRIVAFLGAGEIIDPPHEGDTEPKVGIFVMLQYCSGGDLSHRLIPVSTNSISTFPWKDRLQCAMDIAEGMIFIHGKGVIHRDLKSLNILCDENGRCMIADLGLAKKMGTEDPLHGLRSDIDRSSKNNGFQPVATAWQGTVPWMAPEVIRSGYDNSVDVYSFAIIMWELITGRVPWFGTQYTFSHQIMMAVSQGQRPKIKKKELVHVPVGFVELMKRCWDTHSKRRPNFVDIFNELKIILNNIAPPRESPRQSFDVESDGSPLSWKK